MPPEPVDGARRAVFTRTARRAARSGSIWGLAFGLYVVGQAYGYAATYSTAAARKAFAESLGTNPGLAALYGQARHIDTVAGYTAWRSAGVLSVIGAVWGLLLATKLTRAEEDQGRWELLLAGQTTRVRAAAQAIAGLGVGFACLWAVTAAVVAGGGSGADVGFSLGASLFFATALVSGAAMFLAVGLLAAQLAASRRQANLLGIGVLGACFLLRMVVDVGSGLHWLHWVNPLGWVEELHPLTGSRALALLPICGFIAVLIGVSLRLAAQRDLGASVLPAHDARPPRTYLLTGPFGLTVRLTWAWLRDGRRACP